MSQTQYISEKKKIVMIPKVSVIVPVYNSERCLKRCVDSILNQSYTNIELLLIDDGSKDTSGIICDSYSAKDDRVLVYHQTNGGPGKARNCGLDKATGDYVLFVDSDDWIETHHISSFFIDNYEEYDVIFCGITIEKQTGVYTRSAVKELYEGTSIAKGILDGKDSNFYTSVTKLIRKEIIDNNHIRHNEKMLVYEDKLFTLSLGVYVKHYAILPFTYYHEMLNDDLNLHLSSKVLSPSKPYTIQERYEMHMLLSDVEKKMYDSEEWNIHIKSSLLLDLDNAIYQNVKFNFDTLDFLETNKYIKKVAQLLKYNGVPKYIKHKGYHIKLLKLRYFIPDIKYFLLVTRLYEFYQDKIR